MATASLAEGVEAWARAEPAIRARARWAEFLARPDQLTPPGDWNVWLIQAGRGWGKTRTGAEDVAYYGYTHPGARIGIIAPTYADARDTCVEGESGLLSCLPREEAPAFPAGGGDRLRRGGRRAPARSPPRMITHSAK